LSDRRWYAGRDEAAFTRKSTLPQRASSIGFRRCRSWSLLLAAHVPDWANGSHHRDENDHACREAETLDAFINLEERSSILETVEAKIASRSWCSSPYTRIGLNHAFQEFQVPLPILSIRRSRGREYLDATQESSKGTIKSPSRSTTSGPKLLGEQRAEVGRQLHGAPSERRVLDLSTKCGHDAHLRLVDAIIQSRRRLRPRSTTSRKQAAFDQIRVKTTRTRCARARAARDVTQKRELAVALDRKRSSSSS